MKNPTLLLPGFHLPTLCRKPRSAQQKLADELNRVKQKSFSQLGEFFNKYIPVHTLKPEASGKSSRIRLFSKENTFWAFFSQVLDADGGCKEVIRKLQAIAALKSMTIPSASTAAYCKARKRLDVINLETILKHTSEQLQDHGENRILNNRRVIVVDGTGISMPDTRENQECWPQQKTQKPGCGFPQARICACFCLNTGALLSYELGNKKNHELPLLRMQYDTFKPKDIFLGDKGFCSYYDISCLKDRDVDSVITLARRTPATKDNSVKVLGKDDLLIKWKKPTRSKASSYSETDWQQLPEELILRQIKVTVNQPGFRVSSFYIVTTLLDETVYPANEIADLYFQRWDVELFFRDIKTTMGMDILRCKTPEMVRKEIIMHFIAYNCIRRLMIEATANKGEIVRRVSFKGSAQALRQWEPHINQKEIDRKEARRLIGLLHDSIAENIIPNRPGRSEPRCVKRRPKPHQLMTVPRHEMKVTIHRGRKHAKAA